MLLRRAGVSASAGLSCFHQREAFLWPNRQRWSSEKTKSQAVTRTADGTAIELNVLLGHAHF